MGSSAGIAGLTVIWFYHIKTIQPQRGGMLIVSYDFFGVNGVCRGYLRCLYFLFGIRIFDIKINH
jgi:hypothetical protein